MKIRRAGVFRRVTWIELVVIAALVSGCSSNPRSEDRDGVVATPYFDDARFAASRFDESGANVMQVSPEMQVFVEDVLRRQAKTFGKVKGLIHTLNSPELFGFRYASDETRTAAETFSTRSGNCLSIALLTAALAEMLDLEVEFQSVQVPQVQASEVNAPWLLRTVGHVNLRVAERSSSRFRHWTTIDFLVPQGSVPYRATPIDRERVVSLFFNNKAVESLVEGNLGRAYWWLRASTQADRSSSIAFTSLGVLWANLGQQDAAHAAFKKATQLDPRNQNAEFNLLAIDLRVPDRSRSDRSETQSVAPAKAEMTHVVALIKSGRWSEARQLLSSEALRDLSLPERAWMSALINVGQGQQPSALQTLSEAKERTTNAADAAYLDAKLSRLLALTRSSASKPMAQP